MRALKFTLAFIICFISINALAGGFIIAVKHKCIWKVAVQRNVVTIFHCRGEGWESVRTRLPADFIVVEHTDHASIDHHGHGLDGVYVDHLHLAFLPVEFITPRLLDTFLADGGLDDAERARVIQEYSAHILNLDNLDFGPPLLPGVRYDNAVVKGSPEAQFMKAIKHSQWLPSKNVSPRLILESNERFDINVRSTNKYYHGATPLWFAFNEQQWDLARAMIRRGNPDFNAMPGQPQHRTTMLCMAALGQQWDLVRVILLSVPENLDFVDARMKIKNSAIWNIAAHGPDSLLTHCIVLSLSRDLEGMHLSANMPPELVAKIRAKVEEIHDKFRLAARPGGIEELHTDPEFAEIPIELLREVFGQFRQAWEQRGELYGVEWQANFHYRAGQILCLARVLIVAIILSDFI